MLSGRQLLETKTLGHGALSICPYDFPRSCYSVQYPYATGVLSIRTVCFESSESEDGYMV